LADTPLLLLQVAMTNPVTSLESLPPRFVWREKQTSASTHLVPVSAADSLAQAQNAAPAPSKARPAFESAA
jgi:hypothetical protein